LGEWDARHVIQKDGVDLSQWSLAKSVDDTTAAKMRRERLLAIRSSVVKGNKRQLDMGGAGDQEDEDMPKPKKKVKGQDDDAVGA